MHRLQIDLTMYVSQLTTCTFIRKPVIPPCFICDTNALEQTEVSFKTGQISFLLFGTTYMYTADVCVLTDMFTNTTYDMYF